jgi:peptidoglycan/xylan/chitin deacetylase (PgdA/CDA1 family)
MTPDAVPFRKPLPADWTGQLAAGLATADETRPGPTRVYFRADDVAVPGDRFTQLAALFRRHGVPLGLAVVPAWLTPARWQALGRATAGGKDLWCWHQHGWRHKNHETIGKKQEFGPARTTEAIAGDLTRGRRKLEALMGRAFQPIFTPPWNRCSANTLALLAEMGYKAVSRSRGSRPPAPPGLAELAMDVDLHTGRATSAAQGWRQLTAALTAGLSRPRCGIMIHHQRMPPAAFDFLDRLLEALRRSERIRFDDLRDLTA